MLCTSREQLADVVSLAIEMSGAAFVTPVPEPHADVPLIAICDHIHLDGLAVEVVDRDGVYCSVVPVGTTEHDLRLKDNSIWFWPSTPDRLWSEGLFVHTLDDAIDLAISWHLRGAVLRTRWATTARAFDERGWGWE